MQELRLEKSGGRGPKGEPASDRVIRDYVRRRVLSPTLRGQDSDERGFYGFRHLVEFLAARVLLNDGWPLEKIAERNREATIEDLLALIPGQPPENEALALARSFRPEREGIFEKRYDARDHMGSISDRATRYAEGLSGNSDPGASLARQRAELPLLMRRITGSDDPPKVRRLVAIEIGDQLTLLIDQRLLHQISLADADTIGRAVSATLIDYQNLSRGKEPR